MASVKDMRGACSLPLSNTVHNCRRNSVRPRRLRTLSTLAGSGLLADVLSHGRTVAHDRLTVSKQAASDILKPDVNVVHLIRSPPQQFEDLNSFVRTVKPFKHQVVAKVDSIPSAVEDVLTDFSEGDVKKMLREDVKETVKQYMTTMEYAAVDVTLQTVSTTTCSRYHADHVTVRCLCCYSGPGTLYVENRFVDRQDLLRRLGFDTQGYRVKDSTAVQQAGEWDVLYLKGHAYPGFEGLGAAHRSPDVSPDDPPRLLLKIDPYHENGCHCCPPHH